MPARRTATGKRLGTDHRVRRVDHIPFRRIGDGILVINRSGREVCNLNSTAAWIWEHLEHPTTPGELAKGLCHDYAVTLPEARRETARFLHELTARGLVAFHRG